MKSSSNGLMIKIADTKIHAQKIDIVVEIKNISERMLLVRKDKIYLAQMLHFTHPQDGPINCERHLKYKAPLAKPERLLPGESSTYTIALELKESNPSDASATGTRYLLQSHDCTFQLKHLGELTVYAMFENTKSYQDQLPAGATESDVWIGKVVSESVKFNIATP